MLQDKGNGILFQAELEMIEGRQSQKMLRAVIHFLNEWHRTGGDENKTDQNFSHDNFTGVMAWLYYFGHYEIIEQKFPLWGRHSLHPKDFTFYLWCKYYPLGFLFSWVFHFASFWSCFHVWKHRGDQVMLSTDGKILAFCRNKAIKAKLSHRICEKILALNEKFADYETVFSIYYPDPLHPIRESIRRNGLTV